MVQSRDEVNTANANMRNVIADTATHIGLIQTEHLIEIKLANEGKQEAIAALDVSKEENTEMKSAHEREIKEVTEASEKKCTDLEFRIHNAETDLSSKDKIINAKDQTIADERVKHREVWLENRAASTENNRLVEENKSLKSVQDDHKKAIASMDKKIVKIKKEHNEDLCQIKDRRRDIDQQDISDAEAIIKRKKPPVNDLLDSNSDDSEDEDDDHVCDNGNK
mmetsp:Transcript_29412/g.33016  ORF Transcript_29412/g.33016 Transcript_29412/m.33016 type:complete len:223 (-) Transcript_29412:340-1008(-)